MLINNVTHQRESLTEWPIWVPLNRPDCNHYELKKLAFSLSTVIGGIWDVFISGSTEYLKEYNLQSMKRIIWNSMITIQCVMSKTHHSVVHFNIECTLFHQFILNFSYFVYFSDSARELYSKCSTKVTYLRNCCYQTIGHFECISIPVCTSFYLSVNYFFFF